MSASGATESPTEARDPGRGERPIGYWLKLVDRLIDQSLDDVFQQTGLTRRHWQVLNLVRDGVSEVSAIDDVLSPFVAAGGAGHGAGVSAEIADLQTRGWIAQVGTGWEVTVPGQQAHHDLLDAVSLARERLAEGIPREQYDRTIATLEQMARNLGWSPGR